MHIRLLDKLTATLWLKLSSNFKPNFLKTIIHRNPNKLLFRLSKNLANYDHVSILKLFLAFSTKTSLSGKIQWHFFLFNLINKYFIYQSDWFRCEVVMEIFQNQNNAAIAQMFNTWNVHLGNDERIFF